MSVVLFSYASNILSYVVRTFSYVGIIFWYVHDIYLYVFVFICMYGDNGKKLPFMNIPWWFL